MHLTVDPNASPATTTFRSVHEARNAARQHIADGLREPLVIELAAGEHRLTAPLVLGPADSGTPECPVVWQGNPALRTVLSGGVEVSGWSPCANLPAGTPAAAAGHVYSAPLPDGISRPRVLFDGKGLLSRAESADFEAPGRDGVTSDQTLCFTPGTLPCAPRDDMELFLKPSHPWIVNALPVDGVDGEAGTLHTAIPATYALVSRLTQKTTANVCRLQNVPEGLTEPGRWFVDAAQKRLYLWPRNEGALQEILVPAVTELIRLEGDLEQRAWAGHIFFRHLTLTHADEHPWPAERLSVQHDWELYEGPTALLRLRDAEGVTVEHCTFCQSGGGGIRSERHGVDHTIAENRFTDLGGSGIACIGTPPGDRDENHHNRITRNRIERVGAVLWHASGILLCQSGHNEVRNNLLLHLPYCGITLVSGREGVFSEAEKGRQAVRHDGRGGTVAWDELSDCPPQTANRIGFLTCRYNRVEHNEIHHCMERLGDGNGIYISGTGVGNVARRNWVHDILGQGCQSAIRFDDRQWHCRVEENVVARISGGGITVKDVNDVENNIVVDCRRFGSILVRREGTWGSNIRRNILVQPGTPFPEGGSGLEPPFYDGRGFNGKLEDPTIEDNLLWCTKDQAAGEACLTKMRARGKDRRSVFADPGFVDPGTDDYRLRPESPAPRLGFRPFDSWGLTLPVSQGAP